MKHLLSRFNDWPISRKLSIIVLLTSILLFSLMTLVVSIEKHRSYRSKLVNSSTVLAEVIGANATAALVYKDADSAYEILSALQVKNDIVAAVLYKKDGQLFVSYSNPNIFQGYPPLQKSPTLDQTQKSTQPVFYNDYFDVSRQITLKGVVIGYVTLRTNLAELNKQLLLFLLLISCFSVVLLTGGLVFSARLNRAITEPISQLAESMQEVTKTQNYNIWVEKAHNDEIGILIDGFNTMLSQIQKRDLELEQHRDHLEDLVETRTKELKIANKQVINEIKERQEVQTKLAHAEKMEAIGTLAGGVAHDLNNILSGIVSYPDLLLQNLPKDSALLAPIKTIRSSGKKAAAIVEDLLNLARRGVKVDMQIDLQEQIIEYLESPEFDVLIKRNPKVKVYFERKAEHFLIKGSPVHLTKTIMNLVSNGIEAMTSGGTLTIQLSPINLDTKPPDFKHWRGGPYVCLTVSDTGIGIPQKYLKRIFEPFYSSKVMGKSGTGLGMAVVWGTVEDHKGYITVASKENEGTSFQLFFPADENLKEESVKEPVRMEDLQGDNQTILIVDDSEDQRIIASHIVDHLGYIVATVDSGESAIDYLKNNIVDLVILDMLMPPGLDGLDTYKKIIEFKPEQKAIIASGYSQLSKIEEARSLGVKEYVLKPYSVARVGKALHKAFSRKIS